MKPISRETTSLIEKFLRDGRSHREVARRVGCSTSTISLVRKKLENLPENRNPGRKCVLSSSLKRKIVRQIKVGGCDNAVQINKQIRAFDNVNVCDETVRNVLRANGLRGRSKVKKPLLTKRHRKLRLQFAKAHKNYSIEDWKKGLWSDETKINRFGSDGRQWAWRGRREALTARHVQPTLKFGGGSLMLWGCMNWNGLGNCHRIVGRMTAKDYIDILDHNLFESLSSWGLSIENTTFQHDNDPKHTARITKAWFRENDIRVLDWPPQSPDLNPIEHLWGELKRTLAASDSFPRTLDELWQKVEMQWYTITPEFCQKLVSSMPSRINAVLRAKGGYTKY